MLVAFVLLTIAAFVALYVSAKRAVTIAELVVRGGALRVVRGAIAPSVLRDLRDVVGRSVVDDARIDIVRSSGRAEVSFRGTMSPDQAQRIRNVIGSVPFARLINRG